MFNANNTITGTTFKAFTLDRITDLIYNDLRDHPGQYTDWTITEITNLPVHRAINAMLAAKLAD